MQKALVEMNLKLTVVVSDIVGKTGMAIIKAILAGRRDPVEAGQAARSAVPAQRGRDRQGLGRELAV